MIEPLFDILKPANIKQDTYTFETYAVLDGVKYPMLYSDFEEGMLEYDILFREEKLRTELESVAPFLVKLDFESKAGMEQTKVLLECYGKNGCIFFATPMTFEQTLEKTRELFYLHDDEGKMEGVLRFYEPLIFTELMHTADKETQKSFFANIHSYWCEDADTKETLVLYRYTPEGIGYKKIHLNNKDEERV